MSDINEIDIRLLDGTVLLVFLGLMRHRKATAVAEEMGLTQPAISHAVKRLRGIYGDPLFLRKAHGFEPTAKAREIEPVIRRAVQSLSDSVSTDDVFDPTTSEMSVRIAGFDYELATLLPPLVTEVFEIGPSINISSLTLSSSEALAALEDARIDMAIGFFDALPRRSSRSSFVSETLYLEEYVAVASADHAIFREELSMRGYLEAPHLLVTPTDAQRGSVDFALDELGLSRYVQSTVPMFFPALSVLENSNMIATLPKKVAQTYGARFNLNWVPLPFDGPSFAVRAVWHKRDKTSQIHAWLVDILKSLATDG
ncbi:MAG: LysR family transcriptional regulator [Pseudomonadota bacterium]